MVYSIGIEYDRSLLHMLCLGESPSALYYQASPHGGSACYLAPEVVRGDGHILTTADMWSLGALITFMANDREHCFRTDLDVLRWSGDRSPMRRQFRYPELHDLVLSLLSPDQRLRPSGEEVLGDLLKEEHRDRQNSNYDFLE